MANSVPQQDETSQTPFRKSLSGAVGVSISTLGAVALVVWQLGDDLAKSKDVEANDAAIRLVAERAQEELNRLEARLARFESAGPRYSRTDHEVYAKDERAWVMAELDRRFERVPPPEVERGLLSLKEMILEERRLREKTDSRLQSTEIELSLLRGSHSASRQACSSSSP